MGEGEVREGGRKVGRRSGGGKLTIELPGLWLRGSGLAGNDRVRGAYGGATGCRQRRRTSLSMAMPRCPSFEKGLARGRKDVQ